MSILNKSMRMAIAACFALSSQEFAAAADLSATYAPTRAEWLEVVVWREVSQVSTSWRHRTALLVKVQPTSSEVIVTFTSPNGVEPPTERVRQNYIDTVATMVRVIIERYDWSRGMKVSVQFV